jgi:putative transposase
VQQARNLAMDLDDRLGTLRLLIHDRDPAFTAAFGEVFKAKGLRVITTLPRTPRMNATCERVIGTCAASCWTGPWSSANATWPGCSAST